MWWLWWRVEEMEQKFDLRMTQLEKRLADLEERLNKIKSML